MSAWEPNGLFDDLRKVFLAGVGAVAEAGDRAGEVMDRLAERGEMAVGQGRDLNHELSRKMTDTARGVREAALKARLSSMSEEERAQYVESVSRLAKQIEAEEEARTSDVLGVTADDVANSATGSSVAAAAASQDATGNGAGTPAADGNAADNLTRSNSAE